MDIVEKLKKHLAGKYEFIQLIGRGGFAEVHLVKDVLLEREVAIKILLSQHSSDPEIVERFIREARLYARLEHENLIPIYDTGIIDDYAYIIMKYIKGESLKVLLEREGRVTSERMTSIIQKMARALGYIHGKGIIHRDIKPANILIEEETQNIYLADFGIARADMGKTLTQSGLIIGTPSYISPEQVKGKKIDHRADIYAFGAMLYELAAGKPIFTGDSSLEVLYQHVNEAPEPIANKAPHLIKEIKYIISKCIEKDPNDRFQNAAEILAALEQKRASVVSRYLRELDARGEEARRRRWPLILVFLVLTTVTLFVISSLFVNKGTKQDSDSGKESAVKTETRPREAEKKPVVDKEADKKQTGQTRAEVQKPKESDKKKEEIGKEIKKPPPAVTLAAEPIRVRFSSYPLGAEVYWEDEHLGTANQAFFKPFPPGKYTFRFVIPGYQTLEKEVTISPENKIVHQKFVPYGFISIICQPFANIRIDGQDAGTTPLYKKKLPVGQHTIELYKPGYTAIQETVAIKERKLAYKSFTIKKGEQK